VLVVNPNLRINSVQELLVFAKANPEKLSYASTGNGTTSHLLMAMLSQRTGAKFTHVPYKGSAQSQTDLIAGQVDLTFDSMVSAMPHVKSGKLKALAVSGLSRSAYAADIPTVHEQGVAGFEGGAWLGLLAPAGTPRPIIEKLNRELNAILADPETEKRLLDIGSEMRRGTPEEFGAYIQSERDKWGRLVRESGAKIE
jgi:tripartite-type tricarboxylate transporter receptor subunit TctC